MSASSVTTSPPIDLVGTHNQRKWISEESPTPNPTATDSFINQHHLNCIRSGHSKQTKSNPVLREIRIDSNNRKIIERLCETRPGRYQDRPPGQISPNCRSYSWRDVDNSQSPNPDPRQLRGRPVQEHIAQGRNVCRP